MKTYLYRHFDKDGKLLYIGITYCLERRSYQHRIASDWFQSVAKIESEIFSCRKDALMYEKKAINSEMPIYNKPRKKRLFFITHRTIKNATEGKKKLSVSVPVAEIAEFNRAFELSGFRSKSEFIRFCMFSGMKELYGEAKS